MFLSNLNQMVKNVTHKLLKLILQYQQHILSTHSFVYLCQLFSIIFTFNPTFQAVFTLFVMSIESFTLDSNIIIFFISFLVLTLQLLSNISFVRAIYISVFYIFLTNICTINILSIIICTIALIIDICKNTFRIFTILNLESQPCNQIKAVLCILNIIVVFIPQKFVYFTLSLTVVYFIVLLFRIKNPVSIKNLQILEQLWCVMAIVSLIFRHIINKNIEIDLWINILVTVFGMIGYIVLRILTIQNKLNKLKNNKEQLIKNNQFIPVIQCVFQYLIGSYWQTQTINLIQQFLYNQQQLSSTNTISIQNKKQYLLKLYFITIEHKDDYSNQYQYWSLLYQIQSLSRNNIPSMVIILQIIKKITQQYFIIRYIFRWLQVNKLQQLLQNKISLINQIQQKQYKHKYQIKVFQVNDRFVEKIRQTTQLFISVWNLLRQKCTINFKIDQLIRNKDEIHQIYQELGSNKSKMSTKTYMDYLYYVEKNIDQYHKIYDDFTMSYYPEIDQNIFKLGIYIVLSLEGEIIQITNSNLLGYQKHELEKHTIDVLLPNFIKHVHHGWISKYFDSIQSQHQLQKITRFHKDTFCVNKQGNLKQIDIKLGLCIIDNCVRMAGVVKVMDNKCIAYNKQTHRIVGSSQALNMVTSNHDVISTVKHDTSIYSNQSRSYYQNQSKYDQMKIVTSIQNFQQNQQFILFKKIIVDKEEIWILINNPNGSVTKNILQSNNLVSPPKSKQSVLIHSYNRLNKQISSKTKQFIHNKQQMQTSTYPLKHLITKLIIIFFLFCVFSIILTFMYWNHSKIFQQRMKYSNKVEILQLSSIKSNNLINFVYYLNFIVKQNATFKSVDYNDTKLYQDQITYIKTLYSILKQYPSLMMQQQSNTINNNNESNIKTNTNSLLLFKTMIVSIDWLLTDYMSNDIINSVEQIVHLEENDQKIQEIIGYYQQLILDDQHRFNQLTLNQFIMTICIMTITIAVGIALLILDIRIQKQNNALNLLLLRLDSTELSWYIEDCFNFLQLTYPNNQSQVSTPFLHQPSSSDNNQQSRMITQMSLIQNLSITQNIQIPNNNYRLQTDTDQILIPAQFEQVKCKISKIFMAILIIFIMSIQGILIGSYFFSQSNQVPIRKMMESASALKSQHAVFMSIHLELLGSITNSQQLPKLNSKINNYNTKVNKQLQSYTSQVFSSSEFDKYKQMKNSLDFARMCDYQQCSSEFGTMLNTSYSSSTLNALGYITQISKYLSDKNNSSSLGIQQLKVDHHLQCLVYVSQYLSKLFVKVLGELMSSIKMYLKYLNSLQSIMYNIMIGQWVIMMIMVIWMSYKLWSTRTKGCKILGLFNSKLYTSGI